MVMVMVMEAYPCRRRELEDCFWDGAIMDIRVFHKVNIPLFYFDGIPKGTRDE